MCTNVRSRSLALAAAALTVGLGSHQALAGSQVGHANASIVSAIVVTETTPMNFGYVIPGASAGTLVLSPAGGTTATNVTYLNSAVAGLWNVTGTSGQPMVVTFDASDLLAGPGPSMTMDTFTTDAPATFTSGSVNFHVGATLHVDTAANQTAGNYSGTYTVTVNY
jgi:Mat/Ecp fimbriae major subunit